MTVSREELYSTEDSSPETFNPVRGSAFTVFAQIVRMGIQYGTQLVLARILTPAEFGVVAMVAPVLTLVQLINDVGFGQVIVTRKKIFQDQVSALFWTNMIISTSIGVLLIVVSPLVGKLYGDDRASPLLVALSVSVPLATLFNIPASLMSRRLLFSRLALLEILVTVLSGTIAIALALEGWSYWSIVIGQILAAATGAMAVWLMCRWIPDRPSWSALDTQDLAAGGNLTIANITNFLSGSADNVIVGASAGAEALGLYDRSYRLAVQPISQLLGPIGRIAIPLMSRVSHDRERFKRMFLFLLGTVLFVTVPVFVVCIARGPDVVTFLLGEKWQPAGAIFSWICVGGLTSGVYTALLWLMISENRSRAMVLCTTVVCIISVSAFAIGAFWGALGVAKASGSSFLLISTPVAIYIATRQSRIALGEFVRFCIPFAGAAAAGLLVHLVLPTFGTADLLLSLAISTALCFVVMIVSLQVHGSGRAFLLDCLNAARTMVSGRSHKIGGQP